MGIAANLFFAASNSEQTLDWRIHPTAEQFEAQQGRWNDLADYLLSDLNERSGYTMSSWLQGSYKFGTQIRPAWIGEEFDIDLGVYFRWAGDPDDGKHSPKQIKDMVQASLQDYLAKQENDATEVADPKARCSRIHFQGSFHIDVPSYHLDYDRDARALATESDEWEDSDPKAVYTWWKDYLDESARPKARRIVRYLKMWAALKFNERTRPSSILLTVLVAEAYAKIGASDLSGDDELLREIVEQIYNRLQRRAKVPNPRNASENLNRLTPEDFDNFVEQLDELLSIADQGLAAQTKTDAAEIWSEAFEHFFPLPDQEEVALEESTKNALSLVTFDPQVSVTATTRGLEAVMDRDVVYGLAEHKTDQCNDMQICERLR